MALVWVLTICLVLAFFHSAVAREFVIGGRHGWVVPSGVEPETYNQWSGRNRFLINDTLLFNYNPAEDSVLHVTAPHYDACNTSSPIASYKDAKTLFRLPRQGPFHFISGNRSNCQKGEKLIVVVLAQRKSSHGASAPKVAWPSVVAPYPSFAGAPAGAPSPKVASSSPSPAPAPVAPLSSPSSASSPSPATVVSVPSPSSYPTPVVSVSSPSAYPTPVVPVSSYPTPVVPDSSYPTPVVPLSSPSSASSPSPATVVPVPSPSSYPTPVVPVSSYPTPVVPVSSPASSSPSASLSAPTSSPSPPPSASPPPLVSGLKRTSSPSPPPSASPPPLVSGLNLVMPLLFLAFKTLATTY